MEGRGGVQWGFSRAGEQAQGPPFPLAPQKLKGTYWVCHQ